MLQGWKTRLMVPAIVAVCLAGGAVFGEQEKKENKELSGPRAHPPATQPGESGFGRKPGGRGHEMMRLLSELNLSDEQKTQIREIQSDFFTKMKAFHSEHGDEMKALRDQFKEAMESKDREQAKEIGEKMKKLADENGVGLKAHADKIRSVLNDEQKAKFDEKIKEQIKKHRGMDGMGPGGPRGERMRHEKRPPTTRPAEQEKKELDI